MTLSLSPCFRMSCFFSFSVFGVCSAFFLVPKCLNRVSRKFEGCLKFQRCSKDVSRKFLGCLQKVSRVFPGSLKGDLRKFQECFKEVSRVF